ncbi:MAG: leucyl/phenylalanyl-tRNA--protein transferase [Ignavibacterium sp.]|jgi:leucyl/phenylalanyl-tRNA--protein transferase
MHAGKQAPRILDPEFLLSAYRQGFFPMADSRTGEIHWYSPDPRGILELDGLVISRSLRRTLARGVYEIRMDTAFESVISHCRERAETWISDVILQSYLALHRLGHAHSVEAWMDGRIAGGLYGVAIGGAFFGESMFSLERDASKCALVRLVERLRIRRFRLLDTQFLTPHLASLGATEIPRTEYLRRLEEAIRLPCSFA